jgi:glutamine amidotransferase
MIDVAVVDYGMGNLRSVAKALEHVAPGSNIAVTADPDEIRSAQRIVFPGQGAMPDCMREMDARGLRAPLLEAAKPFLGCRAADAVRIRREASGASVYCREGGAFPGRAHGGSGGEKLKVPHMGWNQVYQSLPHPIWAGIADGSRFYFVHSYYLETSDSGLVAGTSRYPFDFTCAVARNNIFAVQFHPEKSQSAGLRLLSNFVSWDGKNPAFARRQGVPATNA